jgi:serine/threonine protein kinase
MALTSGTKLGRYEVIAPLGKGGMGEVYRARDRRLERDIALKILPESFIKDPEHIARFEREAQVLASFNHPNIAGIYGVEESNSGFALAMELVEGPTLAEIIAASPLEIEEALRVAHDVAEALEAAHERGIIHRDLKPANIRLTSDGKVKVLDFGLAKALATETLLHPLADSPTLPIGSTREGIILGTAAYMSPEQARGKPLDKRSDIWSFGCVLYEALTARKAFPGETTTDILAAVIDREPDWTCLPQNTPTNIYALLRRCLQKDSKQRLHDIADARIEIEEALRPPIKPTSPALRVPIAGQIWPLAGQLLSAVVLTAIITWIVSRITSSSSVNFPRVTAVGRLTHDPDFSESPTWSPDGKMVAFSSNRSGNYEIYVRRIEGGQEVNVTNDPGQDLQPDFSPDGNWIAFVSTRSSRTGMIRVGGGAGASTEYRILGGDIWVVPALGGQARLLARDGNVPAWHPSANKIIYVSGLEDHRALMEVSADGTAPRALLPDSSSNWEITRVRYSPSGRWITFETSERQIFLLSASGGSPRELLNGASHVWDPSGQRIYYCIREPSGGTRLRSIGIDENTGQLRGEPHTAGLLTGMLKDLAMSHDGSHLAASEMEGSLNLTRLPLNAGGDAPAGPEELLSRGQVYEHMPSVSPNGRSIAYISNRLGDDELWINHILTKHSDRLELPGHEFIGVASPHWFPDGRRLAVLRTSPDRKTSIWSVAADGSNAERLPISSFVSTGEGFPVAPDGRTVVYSALTGGNFQLFAFDNVTGRRHQLTSTPGDKYSGSWSPDGRWLVYSSNASGPVQLWKIDAAGGKPEQLTRGDDRIRHPFYSPDGRWLYYQPNHQNIYRMPAGGGGSIQQVTHFPEAGLFIEEPTISPDGRYLVYCRSNGGSSLWLMTVARGSSEHE